MTAKVITKMELLAIKNTLDDLLGALIMIDEEDDIAGWIDIRELQNRHIEVTEILTSIMQSKDVTVEENKAWVKTETTT